MSHWAVSLEHVVALWGGKIPECIEECRARGYAAENALSDAARLASDLIEDDGSNNQQLGSIGRRSYRE